MSFIGYVSYENGSDNLKKLYDRFGGEEKIAHIVKIASPNPKAMEAHVNLYRALMQQPSPVSRDQREMVAVLVSVINHCHYWIEHHWHALHALGNVDDSLKEQLLTDYKTSDISDLDKLILAFAEKITKTPAAITIKDIDNLKEAGLDNQAIHDIAQVASYFNYVNRMADSLGIELEKDV